MLPNQGYHPNNPELNIRPGDALNAPGAVPQFAAPPVGQEPASAPPVARRQPVTPRKSARPARHVGKYVCIIAVLAVFVALGVIFVPRLLNTSSGGSSSSWGISELSGDWIGNNGQKDVVSARIGADGITINWDDGEGTTMLYWQGTFQVPDGSQAEKAVTSMASERDTFDLLASQSDTKDFAVRRDRITFSLSALGLTYTVTMRRK